MSTSKNKTGILILGMHRSGTSAFTGFLEMLGVNLGGESDFQREDNPKGFKEDQRVNLINNYILKSKGSSWDNCEHTYYENKGKILTFLFKNYLKIYLKNQFGNQSLWALKEPRISILLDLWDDILKSLDSNMKIIYIVRNPYEVYNSLKKRNNFGEEKSLKLWLKYNISIIRYLKNRDSFILTFDELLDNPRKVYLNLVKNDIVPNNCSYDSDKIEGFLDKKLKHHNLENNITNDYITIYNDIAKKNIDSKIIKKYLAQYE